MKRKHAIDLNDVIQHPGRNGSFEVSTTLDEFPDVELMGPASGTLEAYGTNTALLLHGDFEARMWVECSRCALRLAETVRFQTDDEFMLTGTPAALSHHSNARVVDDEPFPLFEGNSLLIDDYVHQHLVLNAPTQPLCRADCKGLCPQCGANLNEGRCECVRPNGHEAFRELADLWTKSDDE